MMNIDVQPPVPTSLCIDALRALYASGRLNPAQLIDQVMRAAEGAGPRNIWIHRLSRDQVMAYVQTLASRQMQDLPLYGIPFVIKDNIDLKGVPTTAGCAEFAYTPPRSATVVERLVDAGAIPLGKTNLDQFATGLVGTRSPYGACRNSFNEDFISGGSSAGSAVAVALGLASFALGTDTAGSGRIPAAFNNIIGLKPSLGRLSTQGVVPACRSLDCVSIFALTAADAAAVLRVAEGFDAADAYSRPAQEKTITGLRFGVPRADQLEFFGDTAYADAYAVALSRLEDLGGQRVEVDFTPFLEAARLLYEGPWVAERYAAVGDFLREHPGVGVTVTRSIIEAGKEPTAVAAFQGQYRLMALKRAAEPVWSRADFIVMPTAPTIFRVAAVEADPIRLNARLGYYTNFVNLFDLAAVAVPAGFRPDGLPFGVTLVGQHGTDRALLRLAGRLHRTGAAMLGALNQPFPSGHDGGFEDSKRAEPEINAARPLAADTERSAAVPSGGASERSAAGPVPGFLAIAVCGAHMSGLPLNHQLRERGAYLLEATRTAKSYRLYALPGGPPQRPGLIRVTRGGSAIAVEVWAMPTEQLGSFLAGVPAPLGLGTVDLETGRALGFICEGYAGEDATDVTAHGGWRAYLDSQKA